MIFIQYFVTYGRAGLLEWWFEVSMPWPRRGRLCLDIGLIVGAERMDSERLNSCSTNIRRVEFVAPFTYMNTIPICLSLLQLRHTLHNLPLRLPPNFQNRLLRLISPRTNHPVESRHINIPRPSALACPLAGGKIRPPKSEHHRVFDLRLEDHAFQSRHLDRSLRGRLEEQIELAGVCSTAEVALRLFGYSEGDFLLAVGVWVSGSGFCVVVVSSASEPSELEVSDWAASSLSSHSTLTLSSRVRYQSPSAVFMLKTALTETRFGQDGWLLGLAVWPEKLW